MKKFFYSLIITLVVTFWSWFVYNKFLYHIPVEDIPDSYFTYTGDIYTGTREDNGFYRMIDKFAFTSKDNVNYDTDIQKENAFSGFIMLDRLYIWNKDDRKINFNSILYSWSISKKNIYMANLKDIENSLQYVLYTWYHLYDTLYGTWNQLWVYDEFINELSIINKLQWNYDSEDIENYYFKITGIQTTVRSLSTMVILTCYLKDYDRCYSYWFEAYKFSRNFLYSKWPWLITLLGAVAYTNTLNVADFLIENNMIDDVMYKKMLADLELWNTYDGDQIFHNMKVSEYNFLKYMIYNTEEGERILWGNLSEILFNSKNDNYFTQNKMFFDKDLTHIWLKDIVKNNAENFEKYIIIDYDEFLMPNILISILLDNPSFNHYGIVLLREFIPRLSWLYTRINDTISYRDTIIKKYKDYTPTIIREEIRTGAVVDLSWSQNISWVVLANTSLTGTSDVWDIKKDFAYCQQFKNKISVYIKCIKSIE